METRAILWWWPATLPYKRITSLPAGCGEGTQGGNGMDILYVTSEAAPFCKTGGLADVLGSLPPAVAAGGDRAAVILPLSGKIRLVTSLSVVVFPAPFGPTKPTISPLPTLNEMSLIIRVRPKDLTKCSTRRMSTQFTPDHNARRLRQKYNIIMLLRAETKVKFSPYRRPKRPRYLSCKMDFACARQL